MKEDGLKQERDFQMTSNHFQCEMLASVISSVSTDLAEVLPWAKRAPAECTANEGLTFYSLHEV